MVKIGRTVCRNEQRFAQRGQYSVGLSSQHPNAQECGVLTVDQRWEVIPNTLYARARVCVARGEWPIRAESWI
jgi:hypothetical protein